MPGENAEGDCLDLFKVLFWWDLNPPVTSAGNTARIRNQYSLHTVTEPYIDTNMLVSADISSQHKSAYMSGNAVIKHLNVK
jgi:hypothetical protein